MSSSVVQMQSDKAKPLSDKEAKKAKKHDPQAPIGKLWALNKPEAGWVSCALLLMCIAYGITWHCMPVQDLR